MKHVVILNIKQYQTCRWKMMEESKMGDWTKSEDLPGLVYVWIPSSGEFHPELIGVG